MNSDDLVELKQNSVVSIGDAYLRLKKGTVGKVLAITNGSDKALVKININENIDIELRLMLGTFKILNVPEGAKVVVPPPIEIPHDLQDAIAIMQRKLTKEDKQHILDLEKPDDYTTSIHHTIGRILRNDWNLWDQDQPLTEYFKSIGIHHADDSSSIIIISFIRTVRGKDIKLDEQIKYYRDYWKRQGQDPDKLAKETT